MKGMISCFVLEYLGNSVFSQIFYPKNAISADKAYGENGGNYSTKKN
jgi:hypothetical protein